MSLLQHAGARDSAREMIVGENPEISQVRSVCAVVFSLLSRLQLPCWVPTPAGPGYQLVTPGSVAPLGPWSPPALLLGGSRGPLTPEASARLGEELEPAEKQEMKVSGRMRVSHAPASFMDAGSARCRHPGCRRHTATRGNRPPAFLPWGPEPGRSAALRKEES